MEHTHDLPLTYFGPFEFAFRRRGPGYMELLGGIDRADAEVVVERIEKALDAPDAARFVDAMLSEGGWRPHLVACVAHLLDQTGKVDRDLLWRAIDGESWVIPQLVATAALCDEQFATKARVRVERGSAPKLLASILGVCAASPVLQQLEPVWRRDPRLLEVLEKDVDRSDLLAASWMASAQRLLLKRGLASRPERSSHPARP
jgi:hypothetical protein